MIAPFAGAQDEFQYYVEPVTDAGKSIESLFNIVTVLAAIVFVVVNVALFYTLWKFRNNKDVPKGELYRGHTKAEIAWTVIPALVLIFIGIISVQTLTELDTFPSADQEGVVTVKVEGQQFAWVYEYPDGSTSINQMYVEEGSLVRMEISAKDVMHAVWIPEFGVKIDAIPHRLNLQKFTAPGPGEYFLQCAEYCGVGHHGMRGSIVVFATGAGPDGKAYGNPADAGNQFENIPKDVEVNMTVLESGGSGNAPWSIEPPTLTVQQGEGVHVLMVNPAGQSVHNLTFPDFGVTTDAKTGGQNARTAFVADKTGSFVYFCGIPGHRQLGMVGTLVVQ